MMNYSHLLEQADKLIGLTPSGAPRQADLRRAISTAYYALFHFAMAAASDMAVGRGIRRTAPDLYTRVYRSLDHKDFVNRSKESRSAPGIGADIKAFADAVVELQRARHDADYDPVFRISKSDAITKVSTARDAIIKFESAAADEQNSYLTTLLFKPR
jgi:hypothetical protein